MATHKRILDSTKFNLKDQVVAINRVTKWSRVART